MTEQKARSTDDLLQEIKRVGEVVDTARRVILIGGDHRSMLAGQLSERLKGLGLVVTIEDPASAIELAQPEAVGPLFKNFADILACPSLSHLFGDLEPPPTIAATKVVRSDPLGLHAILHGAAPPSPEPITAEQIPEAEPATEAALASLPGSVPDIPYRGVLMGYPETWTVGDVFEDHPRYTLMHLRRKWVLESFDGADVELGSPNTPATDLIPLETFQARYVFHSHAQTPAE